MSIHYSLLITALTPLCNTLTMPTLSLMMYWHCLVSATLGPIIPIVVKMGYQFTGSGSHHNFSSTEKNNHRVLQESWSYPHKFVPQSFSEGCLFWTFLG